MLYFFLCPLGNFHAFETPLTRDTMMPALSVRAGFEVRVSSEQLQNVMIFYRQSSVLASCEQDIKEIEIVVEVSPKYF